MRIVISEPKTARSYQVEIPKEREAQLYGLKIGNVFDGAIIGAPGYKLKITGGSDRDGFPMRADVEGTGRKRILLITGPGYRRKKKGEWQRKTVRGNTVSEFIVQLNCAVVEAGPMPLEEIFKKEEKK